MDLADNNLDLKVATTWSGLTTIVRRIGPALIDTGLSHPYCLLISDITTRTKMEAPGKVLSMVGLTLFAQGTPQFVVKMEQDGRVRESNKGPMVLRVAHWLSLTGGGGS